MALVLYVFPHKVQMRRSAGGCSMVGGSGTGVSAVVAGAIFCFDVSYGDLWRLCESWRSTQ